MIGITMMKANKVLMLQLCPSLSSEPLVLNGKSNSFGGMNTDVQIDESSNK